MPSSLKLSIAMTTSSRDSVLLPGILAILPEGVVICSRAGDAYRITHANQMAADLLSFDGTMEGQALEACFTRHMQSDRLKQTLRRVIKTEKAETVQIENHADGMVSWLSVSFAPFGNHLLCRIDNICDQKISDMRLAQAHKLEALGQLAGGVAHDFNNILSIIDGYARLAVKEIDNVTLVADHLDKIRQSVRRGATLTKQLLAFGRKSMPDESTVDLGILVRDHEGILHPLLDASIRFSIYAEENIYVDSTPDLIGQIRMNLILNARAAMTDGGDIAVTVSLMRDMQHRQARAKGDHACLSVSDTGTGMDKTTQRRIFDPFFTTKEQGKGTGLGLSMVYGLMQQMKGFIDVDSVPGKGTTMNLYFPVTKAPGYIAAATIPGHDAAVPQHLNGYTALVAEDEPDLLGLVASMLRDMGMNVLTAANGNEALARQEDYEGHIDFLVTDVVMPEMSGVRLSELFSSVRPDAKTVFISGYPAAGNMARIDLPDGACLLSKPVAYERLAQVLGTLTQGAFQTGLSRMAGEWPADPPGRH